MALTKTRKIGKLLNNNFQVDVLDSERINVSINKGSNISGDLIIVDTSDDLPGNSSTGRKAYVLSTKTLYIFNGSGWFKIASVNNFNPQWIIPPDSDYSLELISIDSDVKITLYATDSDQVPITYTATVDSDFNVAATITHDSDKDPVWIVRRRDSESGAGPTGDVTFKASDGVNVVSFVSTFTVASNAAPFSGINGTNYGIFGRNTGAGASRQTGSNPYGASDGLAIQRTPFATDSPFTAFASPYNYRHQSTGGAASSTHGYINTGYGTPSIPGSPTPYYPQGALGEKFPLASGGDTSTVNTMDFSSYPKALFGQGNATVTHDDGYFIVGGGNGFPTYGAPDSTSHVKNMSKVTYANDTISFDVATLDKNRDSIYGGGGQSETTGYVVGGRQPTHVSLDDSVKFPKAASYPMTTQTSFPGTRNAEGSMSFSAPDHMLNMGSSTAGAAYVIYKMPFSTESWSTTGWSLDNSATQPWITAPLQGLASYIGDGTAYKMGVYSDTKGYKMGGAPFDNRTTTTVIPYSSLNPSSGTVTAGTDSGVMFQGVAGDPAGGYSGFQSSVFGMQH